MNKNIIRVRFAPSPTGPLHIGGLRTALYNFLFFAKKKKNYKKYFILRIDDTDSKRNIKSSIKYILKSFKWCKIKYNEGYNNKIKKNNKYEPYIQSKRLNIYKKYLNILIKKKLVYFSFEKKQDLINYNKKYKNFIYNNITRNSLNNSLNKNLNSNIIKKYIKSKNYVIRLKTPINKNIYFYDKTYGKIIINTNKIDDKILFRSNNIPTYHFTNVIDDYIMKITHIIRGKEWLSSTPLHIILYKYFNWKIPNFIHLPLLLNNDNTKISKRNYNNNIIKNNYIPIFPINSKFFNIKNSFKKIGFIPEALINIIALLGWTPDNNIEILNFKNIIKNFNINNINKSDIKINYYKMCWINKKHIFINKNKIKYKIYKILKKFLIKNNIINIYNKNIIINKIILYTINRISLININDIWNNVYYFFINPINYNINSYLKKYINSNKKNILLFLSKFNKFFKYKINNNKLNKLINNIKINNINYIKIIRIIIVGKLTGINLYKILYILNNNKKIIYNRIKNFINIILKS
ncbi:MAG: hypothetical protein RDO_1340 [Flavobacteriales endosymbiont of Rhyzopertha dominica]|nr:MAG: glutamate--tRNA ligase [Candidatus Shikimatogenerans bostrichidophilus]